MVKFKLQKNILLSILFLSSVSAAIAQTNNQNLINLFKQDESDEKDSQKTLREAVVTQGSKPSSTDPLNVKANDLKFDKDGKTVIANNGVEISGQKAKLSAESAVVNTETKQANLDGNVVVGLSEGSILSSKVLLNIDDETGEFEQARTVYEVEGYRILSDDMFKLSENRYKLYNASFSTCEFSENKECDWNFNAEQADITKEGYAHLHNVTMDVAGVPVIYLPYMGLPVKTERTSGLLVPSLGRSNRNGMLYSQPYFFNIDESTDLTVSPFVNTSSRYGSDFRYKQYYSKNHDVDSLFVYSNESLRGDSRRGLNDIDYFDKRIDTNRLGVYYSEYWKADKDAPIDLKYLAEIHYASDDFLIRELRYKDIGLPQDQYLPSQVMLRAPFLNNFEAELKTSYDQSIYTDDSTLFQRLPEFAVNGLKSFRPIGANALGLKLVTKADYTVTEFSRVNDYDGLRRDGTVQGVVPFHLGSALTGSGTVGFKRTDYSVSGFIDPAVESNYTDDTRSMPYLRGQLGTSLEKVYQVDSDSMLHTLTSLGQRDHQYELVRTKHVIEPFVKYTKIPRVNQDNLPLFDDGLDRIAERDFVRYGIKNTLVGRFVPRKNYRTGGEELIPEVQDIGGGVLDKPMNMLGIATPSKYELGGSLKRDGEIRDIAALTIDEGYDRIFYENKKRGIINTDSPYQKSDIGSRLDLTPTSDFGLSLGSFYRTAEARFTGYNIGFNFQDDRGDIFGVKYDKYDPVKADLDPRQDFISWQLEARITDRVRWGMVSQYDLIAREMNNNKMALRFLGKSNCWSIDIGATKRINPDDEEIYIGFTLGGIGNFQQGYNTNQTSTVQ